MEHTTRSYFLLLLVIIADSIGDGLYFDLKVRLVGPSRYRGMLEVRRNESEPWGTVCNKVWKNSASNVVCFQLNLGGGTEINVTDIATSGDASSKGIVLEKVKCKGNESTLGQCSGQWGVHQCSDGVQVGVECDILQDFKVRLEGGNSTKEGRVVVRRTPEESWGTVCDDQWDDHDATVVCRQLNLGTTGQATEKGFHGQGTGPIYLDEVQCRGTESNLGHCKANAWNTTNCQHSEDAGVICTGEVSTTTTTSTPTTSTTTTITTTTTSQTVMITGTTEPTMTALTKRSKVLTLPTSATPTASTPRSLTTTLIASTSTTLGALTTTEIELNESEKTDALRNLAMREINEDTLPKTANATKAVLRKNTTTSALDVILVANILENATSLSNIPIETATDLLEIVEIVAGLNQTVLERSNIADNATNRGLGPKHKNYLNNLQCVVCAADSAQLTQKYIPTELLLNDGRPIFLLNIYNINIAKGPIFSWLRELDRRRTWVIGGDVNGRNPLWDTKFPDQSCAMGKSHATYILLQAVESLGDRVSLGESGSTRIPTENIVLQVWNLTTVSDSHVLGLKLPLDSGEVTEVTEGQGRENRAEGEWKYDNTDTSIMLPGKTFCSIAEKHPGQDIRISASIFTQTSLFRSSASAVTDDDTRHRNTTLNSKVIALRITVDGQPITNLSAFGNGSVTTVFTPVQSLSKDQREWSRCVFWDFALQDGKGAWSEKGCNHSDTVQGKLVCECDHLTNFAVILDPYDRKEKIAQVHESALSLISKFGLSLSIAGLSVTVISFIAIKKLHSSHPQQTLFNMALALLLAWVTFLAGFSRVHGHASCVLVAALLHYLILVSFMWMVIEGILQYLLLVKVMATRFSRYMLKTALPAWGLPLIPVIIILSIDVNLYSGVENYCWMSRTPFYYAFMTPIIIMVSTNIVLYVLVVASICRRRDMSHGGTSYNAISIRASIGCFVVLGLSWGFAFLAIEDARLVFQYLFTCTTALQGFLIFAIFTARDPAVRQFWLDLICRRKQAKKGSRGPLIQSDPNMLVTKETSFSSTK